MVYDPTSSLDALLRSNGIAPVQLPDETGTAEQAAKAVGCSTRQIMKSLLLMSDNGPVFVLAAGDRQVDLEIISSLLAITGLRMARATEVKDLTGFAIGGVPPVGHLTKVPTVMDIRLLDNRLIYAAAGNRFRVFPVEPELLREMADARVMPVSASGSGSAET